MKEDCTHADIGGSLKIADFADFFSISRYKYTGKDDGEITAFTRVMSHDGPLTRI